MPSIYTIGYEGADLDDFLATLRCKKIKRIIDVRDYPVSRKPGFSKKVLADALEIKEIAYVHLNALGDPKKGRDAAKLGHFDLFRDIFLEHLRTQPAQAALAIAEDLIAEMPSCLLCFERLPDYCHRKIIANAIAENTRFPIEHLGVPKGAARKKMKRCDCAPDRELAFW